MVQNRKILRRKIKKHIEKSIKELSIIEYEIMK
ncbi:hypothetical protein RSJ2_1324 [Clostridium botulinum]|nr:hypothetical protein T257_442 [Clostridium botulinum CDC_297]AJE13098.1 hypothetical protein T259_3087 [Clostridium botulinum CDC_1436]APQ99237.1 hypothetical protein RSJ2_1324 [Clostridium botulinum]APU60182.1 hypothetical protein NPD8_2141 [Clostridium botulinum]